MFYKNGWMGHINYSEKFSNDSDTITTNSSFEPINKEEMKTCKSCNNICLCTDIFCSKCGEKL